MPNQGLWTIDDAVIEDKLNAGLLQKIAVGSADNTQTGMVVWDDSTSKIHRMTGSGTEVVVDVDAVAGTASLRTLGTGAQQSSAGNHTHAITEAETDKTQSDGTASSRSILDIADIGTAFGNAISRSITVNSTASTIVIGGFIAIGEVGPAGETVTAELRRGTTQLTTATRVLGSGTSQTKGLVVEHTDVGPAAGATTYDMRSMISAGVAGKLMTQGFFATELVF